MRFRRTRDELARGLTPTQAQEERAIRLPGEGHVVQDSGIKNPEPPQSASGTQPLKSGGIRMSKVIFAKQNGEIVLRIRPGKDVDPDYFEHLKGKEIEVTQDELFYKWIDHYLDKIYDGVGNAKLFQDILDKGIGEVINTVHFEKDIGK